MSDSNLAGIIKFLHPTADFDSPNGNVELRDNSDGNGTFIHKWTLAAPKPTIASLNIQEAAYLASVATENAARKGRKIAVNAKMGLVAGDIDALAELIEDKNLD